MKIQLSDHFNYSKLIRFTLPTIVMMIFTSIYSVVDGFFISNFVGITPFAAINLIMPFTQILGCIGFMFGAGGSALASATLGEGDREKANRIFSMLVYITMILGALLAVLGILFIEPVALAMGADSELLPHCVTYGRILLITLPAFMLQNIFQSFLVTAEKPILGLAVTVGAGLTNMVLDALFIAGFRWGLVGAAAATDIAQCIGGIVPLVFFARKNSSTLKLGKFQWDAGSLLSSCANGSSELVSNISMSVVSILYNYQLMRFSGESGVAAYGAVMYVGFIFAAVFLGYSIGAAPVIGFHYGAKNQDELKGLFRKSMTLVTLASIVLAFAAFILSEPLAKLFVGSDPGVLRMTVTAFHFYALSVLFSGFNIFGSAFFTALNNGIVSAAISFLRTLLFQIVCVLILPIFFELNGVWYSLFVAEIFAMLVTLTFYIVKRREYHYF